METEKWLLLVDDDVDLLEMSARRLKRKGFEVLTASNLAEAKAQFDSRAKDLKGVICDLFLASENGISFYEYCKTKEFAGEFVLATGDDSGDDRIAKLRSEARFSCLQKPFDLQILMDILARQG